MLRANLSSDTSHPVYCPTPSNPLLYVHHAPNPKGARVRPLGKSLEYTENRGDHLEAASELPKTLAPPTRAVVAPTRIGAVAPRSSQAEAVAAVETLHRPPHPFSTCRSLALSSSETSASAHSREQ